MADVYIPSSYNGQSPMPLVILLHSYGGSGASQESYMRFRPLAEARGFLYCYPNDTIDQATYAFRNVTDASGDFWNTGVYDAG